MKRRRLTRGADARRFTPQEALDALPDVIYHLETFEQVRASVPMVRDKTTHSLYAIRTLTCVACACTCRLQYLLSRKIKGMGVKMVLSGEGADEEFGGYLYFHKAPNAVEFHKEVH